MLGLAVDDENGKPIIIRKQGNIKALEKAVEERNVPDTIVNNHVGIAHTRFFVSSIFAKL